MRTLARNKRPIWYVEYLGELPILDSDGYDTGFVEKQYSESTKIYLNLYNTNSEIIEQLFGTVNNINIVCSSENVKLKKGTKLYYEEPTEDIDLESDFDLELIAISKSLNHWNYGFREVN